jgi:hypothetical protein
MQAYFTNLEEKIQHGCRSASRLEKRIQDLHMQYMLELQDKSEKLLAIVSCNSPFDFDLYHLRHEFFAHARAAGRVSYFIVLGSDGGHCRRPARQFLLAGLVRIILVLLPLDLL